MRSLQERKDRMALNAEAVLFGPWLIPRVEIEIERREADRIFFRDSALDAGERGKHGHGPLYDHLQFMLTPDLLRRYDFVQNHRNHGDEPARIGWREIAEPSAQVVVYPDWTFELDFDLFSPVRDLRGIFGHFFIEWWWPRLRYGKNRPKTDPFRVAEQLWRKRGIG